MEHMLKSCLWQDREEFVQLVERAVCAEERYSLVIESFRLEKTLTCKSSSPNLSLALPKPPLNHVHKHHIYMIFIPPRMVTQPLSGWVKVSWVSSAFGCGVCSGLLRCLTFSTLLRVWGFASWRSPRPYPGMAGPNHVLCKQQGTGSFWGEEGGDVSDMDVSRPHS